MDMKVFYVLTFNLAPWISLSEAIVGCTPHHDPAEKVEGRHVVLRSRGESVFGTFGPGQAELHLTNFTT